MNEDKTDTRERVVTRTREDVREPQLYKVLLHNDDYTTMEFVVDVLMTVFQKSEEDAVQIMLNVHRKGVGLCGVYTYEVAETKVEVVHALAMGNSFPLRCTMEV